MMVGGVTPNGAQVGTEEALYHCQLATNLRLVSLKIKGKVRGNKHLFENDKNNYLESTYLSRSVNSVSKAGGVYEKGKGNNYTNRRKTFLLVQII